MWYPVLRWILWLFVLFTLLGKWGVTAAICLSKNPILHSRAKHIEIKHHFIIDYVQKGILDIQFIDTEHQWINIFTKPLTVDRFDFIKKNLNMHFVSD